MNAASSKRHHAIQNNKSRKHGKEVPPYNAHVEHKVLKVGTTSQVITQQISQMPSTIIVEAAKAQVLRESFLASLTQMVQ